MRDLLEEMGIGKGSFYAVFGSKQGLFVSALQLYRNEHSLMNEVGEIFAGCPVREAFIKVLGRVIERSFKDGGCCLFAKAALEFRQGEPEIATEIEHGIKEVEKVFCVALVAAKEKGEISENKDPESLARYFVSVFYGLQIMANGAFDREAVETVVADALKVLD